MAYIGNCWPNKIPLTSIVEMANEFLVVVLTYHLFAFMYYSEDTESKVSLLGTTQTTFFVVGQSFIYLIIIIFFLNITYMVRNIIASFLSYRRKAQHQKSYEEAFAKWLDS
mmetsp:Transcript_36447/g.55956  ORF Transcript_36447/g.55956 Transcript_36447/m.55956 type:complete len:111 (-) Transcript_36447:2118-2450(-)